METHRQLKSSDLPPALVCAFCGEPTDQEEQSAYAYPVWKCTCSAVGSGAWAPDLDEVADQLLEVLGIAGQVSQPSVPIDESGRIFAQPYDANEAKRELGEILRQHNHELRVNAFHEGSRIIQCLWVRKRVA